MSRPLGKVPPHGTRARYVHRMRACRRSCCRAANAAYQRERRALLARRCSCTPSSLDVECAYHHPPLPGVAA